MNLDSLKSAARSRWPEIISRLAGVDSSLLDGKHHPCPSGKCGSTKDAFRVFSDFAETGGCVCNQEGKRADGFATLQWLLGCEFKEAARLVAEHLGIDPAAKKPRAKFEKPITKITTLSLGIRLPFARDFATAKIGIEVDQLLRSRWAPALWPRGASRENQSQVLAFVAYRLPSLAEHSFILYRRNGSQFPASKHHPERGHHILPGSAKTGEQDGIVIVGTPDEFRAATRCFKCEGITDAVALASLLDAGEIAIANICGAGSTGWLNDESAESFAHFNEVVIVGDNEPSGVGLAGAMKLAGVFLA